MAKSTQVIMKMMRKLKKRYVPSPLQNLKITMMRLEKQVLGSCVTQIQASDDGDAEEEGLSDKEGNEEDDDEGLPEDYNDEDDDEFYGMLISITPTT